MTGVADLEGRVAIVTGAGRGIGQAICLALGRAGSGVVAVDVVEPEHTVRLLEAERIPVTGVTADVSSAPEVEQVVERAVASLGQIDILVNNAGVAERAALLELDDETFMRCVRVNVLGSFHLIQAVYPHMRASGSGRIINISSISGKNGGARVREGAASVRTGLAYAATKGAIDSLTRWVARECGHEGIRSNAVCPGPIESEMTAGIDYGVEDQPITRMGRPEEIASAVVYLASDMSSFVTGQTLNVDGGRVMS